MKIVGCDLHTRYQQVAMLDEETGWPWSWQRLYRTHCTEGSPGPQSEGPGPPALPIRTQSEQPLESPQVSHVSKFGRHGAPICIGRTDFPKTWATRQVSSVQEQLGR